MHVVEDNALVK